jgi:hypothetical protein
MIRLKLCASVAVALGVFCLAPAARADVFQLNALYCNCLLTGSSAGTVTVTQAATNIVDVLVNLNSPEVFHQSNGLDGFVFNINGGGITNPTLTQITSGTLSSGNLEVINGGGSTWTLTPILNQPVGHEDGAGYFQYALTCGVGSGACTGNPNTLEFKVDVAGLVVGDLETKSNSSNGSNVFFAANVANPNTSGCTGMAGAGGTDGASGGAAAGTSCAASTPTPTPEPTSILFFGTGLLVAGVTLRRKLTA